MFDEKHRSSGGGLRTHSWFKSSGSSKLSMRWLRRSSWGRKDSHAPGGSTTALISDYHRGRTPPHAQGYPETWDFGKDPQVQSVIWARC